MASPHNDYIYLATALACALVGAAFDVKSRRIPNFITLPSMLIGMAMHLALNGWRGLGLSLAAGLIAGVIFAIFWIAGGMGAGDVKLMTAVACLAGLPHVAWLLSLTALAGGVMAIGLAVVRGRLKETVLNVGAIAAHHRHEGLSPHPHLNVRNEWTLRLPYGLAIAAGTALSLCMTVVGR